VPVFPSLSHHGNPCCDCTGPAAHAHLHEEAQRSVRGTGRPCSAVQCSAGLSHSVPLSSPAASGDRRWPLADVSHGRDTGTVPRQQQHVPAPSPSPLRARPLHPAVSTGAPCSHPLAGRDMDRGRAPLDDNSKSFSAPSTVLNHCIPCSDGWTSGRTFLVISPLDSPGRGFESTAAGKESHHARRPLKEASILRVEALPYAQLSLLGDPANLARLNTRLVYLSLERNSSWPSLPRALHDLVGPGAQHPCAWSSRICPVCPALDDCASPRCVLAVPDLAFPRRRASSHLSDSGSLASGSAASDTRS
jgi:hypothetical protein